MKKIMLGTSDAWSMSHSFHRPSEPAYYIEDCRILSICGSKNIYSNCQDFSGTMTIKKWTINWG